MQIDEDIVETAVAGAIVIAYIVLRATDHVGDDPVIQGLLFIAVAAIFGNGAIKKLR